MKYLLILFFSANCMAFQGQYNKIEFDGLVTLPITLDAIDESDVIVEKMSGTSCRIKAKPGIDRYAHTSRESFLFSSGYVTCIENDGSLRFYGDGRQILGYGPQNNYFELSGWWNDPDLSYLFYTSDKTGTEMYGKSLVKSLY